MSYMMILIVFQFPEIGQFMTSLGNVQNTFDFTLDIKMSHWSILTMMIHLVVYKSTPLINQTGTGGCHTSIVLWTFPQHLDLGSSFDSVHKYTFH